MSRMSRHTAYNIASLCPPLLYPNRISKFQGKCRVKSSTQQPFKLTLNSKNTFSGTVNADMISSLKLTNFISEM